ncbi:iron-sulfur cluster assembly accessory protein [Paenalkalicoccus suaedae]|uniref:Iron-sulfur cluster assembly accessory protein n=1 Tax=Paenalkalicoccus suaedae TaxID=2592382 RepID=A0A859FHB1_9BACI|nr:iron-sulfur cluster assembly accessory protein [Paenalkalicoccus suaedae]QKS72180.1 iron-sulfur cluster assembly accessory protein [Paenalkalicoccus suaedae]
MITITDAAASQVKEMLASEEDAKFLRVGVQGGGCTGLSYGMGFAMEAEEDDQQLSINGIDLVVDKESAPMLDGVTIDYKQNMMGGGFTLDNPNAIANCGCGASFRTATNAGAPENC